MTRPITAVLVGATGLIGRQVLPLLCASPRWGRVIVLARSPAPAPHPRVDWRVVDFDAELRFDEAVDDVFCCLGTTIRRAGSKEAFRRVDHHYPVAVAKAARAAGAEQFVIVTALGADAKSSVFYNRVKGDVQAELATIGFPSLLILQPSLLLGDREESRPGERVFGAVLGALAPVLQGPLKRYRAISAATVARAMVRLAESPVAGVAINTSDRLAEVGEEREAVPAP